MTEYKTVPYDLETYPNFWSGTFMTLDGKEVFQFAIGCGMNQLPELKKFLKQEMTLVGYNNLYYDNPILRYLEDSYYDSGLNARLFELSKKLISDDFRQDREILSLRYPREKFYHWDSIDMMGLFALNNFGVSLKQIGIILDHHRIQDLPYEYNKVLTEEEAMEVLRYNINDVDITRKFYLKEKDNELKIRLGVGSRYGLDLRSHSRSKMGNAIFTKYYSENTGLDPKELKDLRTKRDKVDLSNCIADNIEFKTDVLKRLLTNMKGTTVYRKGKKEFPVRFPIHFKGTTYTVASGGLHSDEKAIEFRADETSKIITCDIASMYPTCMINNKVAPAHLDADEFISILKRLTDERVEAKRTNKMLADALKITINGIYWKTNSDTFWLEDAEAMLKVTISGQLYLLMLVEMLESRGIHCISANTDGIECQVPLEKESLYYDVCSAWEKKTNFVLEYNEYEFYVKRHVNSYVAHMKSENWYANNWRDFQSLPFDKLKTKGDFVPHPEYLRAYKHPVVSKALNAFYSEGIPVLETILKCDNIFDFCISKKSDRSFDIFLGDEKLQRTNRFFISNSGKELYTIKRSGKEKGKKTGIWVGFGAKTLNDYDENTPFSEYDVNKMWYVVQANNIITKMKLYVPDMFAFVEDYGEKENLFPDVVLPTKEEVAPVKEKDVLEANRTRQTFDVNNKYLLVTKVNTTYSPVVEVYSLGKGTMGTLKVKKNDFRNKPIRVGDVIFANTIDKKQKVKKEGKEYIEIEGYVYWISNYDLVTDFNNFKRKVVK